MSVDPAAPSKVDDQSLDPYAYCRNNPLSQVDPTGESWVTWVSGAARLTWSTAYLAADLFSLGTLDMTHANLGVNAAVNGGINLFQYTFGDKQDKEQVREGLGLQETMSAAEVSGAPLVGAAYDWGSAIYAMGTLLGNTGSDLIDRYSSNGSPSSRVAAGGMAASSVQATYRHLVAPSYVSYAYGAGYSSSFKK